MIIFREVGAPVLYIKREDKKICIFTSLKKKPTNGDRQVTLVSKAVPSSARSSASVQSIRNDNQAKCEVSNFYELNIQAAN